MRSSLLVSASIVVVAFSLSCGSDDNDNTSGTGGASTGPSLAGFDGSDCKKESLTMSGTISQPLTADDVYAGLQCVRWNAIDDGFRIALINFEGACGAEWKGQVAEQEQDVELRLVNPQCMMASCGWCIYDWTFDVRMSAADGGNAFSIVVDTCPGEQEPGIEGIQLPLATEPSGERCRYANINALGWQAGTLDTCGAAYMPCRDTDGMCGIGSTAEACDPDLVCADGAKAGAQICHHPCQSDADCVPESQMKCDGDVCRPKNPW